MFHMYATFIIWMYSVIYFNQVKTADRKDTNHPIKQDFFFFFFFPIYLYRVKTFSNKSRRNFKEPSLQIVLWSLHCFVLFSFVFYMNYHLYFIWIVIHCSYTEAIMFLIFGLLLLKWILCISCILCVLKLCVYTGQHGRTASGWMFLPCINILEIKKK